jgi:hypothetical protein
MTTADDDPITLAEACELVFHNRIRVPTLRREKERGNLVTYRVGRRDFTTVRDVREMLQRCRDAGQHPGSTSIPGAASGLSATDQNSSALVALNQTVEALKGASPNTSPGSISRSGHRRHLSQTS